MAGPLGRSYGAATMAGKDERNGRINPALECDDDLPVAEARRLNQATAQEQVERMLNQATGQNTKTNTSSSSSKSVSRNKKKPQQQEYTHEENTAF